MRTIKFRAYFVPDKEMIVFDKHFMDGDNSCLAFYSEEHPGHLALPNSTGEGYTKWINGHEEVEIEGAIELMQFTGLKDKNGVEIYEGDIISVNESNPMEIIFETGAFGVIEKSSKLKEISPLCLFYERYKNDIEVIGNKYEPPELLNNLTTN